MLDGWQFVESEDKDTVFRYVKNLKGKKNFAIQEQYPPEVVERRKRLWPRYKEAKAHNAIETNTKINVKWQVDKLILDGRVHTAKDDTTEINPEVHCEDADIDLAHTEHVIAGGSTFIGHAASISHRNDIPAVLAKLLQDKVLAHATHNAYAYCVGNAGSPGAQEGVRDDGEHGAGAAIMKVINDRKMSDIIVIVSRFYGGTHMGPKRFQVFKDCTKKAIKLLHDESDTESEEENDENGE